MRPTLALDVVLINGELFLVTADILWRRRRRTRRVVRTVRQPFWETVGGGCCLIGVVLITLLFADVLPCGRAPPPSIPSA
jgi:hypothetical protein